MYLSDAPESMRLIGSHDGIDWDPQSDTCIATGFDPDTHSSIVWDPRTERFAWFTRATNLYRNRGARRKVARLEHDSLWDEWPLLSENILLPDQVDGADLHHYFYGMPTRYYAGVYWGFLWPYQHQEDIYTALAWSRDGKNFQRPADRPRLIAIGAEGEWAERGSFDLMCQAFSGATVSQGGGPSHVSPAAAPSAGPRPAA